MNAVGTILAAAAAASVAAGFVVWLIKRLSRIQSTSERLETLPAPQEVDFGSDVHAAAGGVQTEEQEHSGEPPTAGIECDLTEAKNQKTSQAGTPNTSTPFEPEAKGLEAYPPHDGEFVAECVAHPDLPASLIPENATTSPSLSTHPIPEPFRASENVEIGTAVDGIPNATAAVEANLAFPATDEKPGESKLEPTVSVEAMSGITECAREKFSNQMADEMAQPVPRSHPEPEQPVEKPVRRYRPPPPRRPQPRQANRQPTSPERFSEKENVVGDTRPLDP